MITLYSTTEPVLNINPKGKLSHKYNRREITGFEEIEIYNSINKTISIGLRYIFN